MKRIVVLLLGIMFLAACSERKSQGQQGQDITFSFDTTDTLKCCDSILMAEPLALWDWKITKQHVFVHTPLQSKFLKVYDYPSIKQKLEFGECGKQKDEFITHSWCKTSDNTIGLYDIMKSKLYHFSYNDQGLFLSKELSFRANEDGMCPPYTKIKQVNGPLYLMKEDGEETFLVLANLESGKVLSRYKCEIREKGKAYTPWDFDFDICHGSVLLAYNFMSRIELLQITKDNQLVCQEVWGKDAKAFTGTDYNNIPYHFIQVVASNSDFYCLVSSDGGESGNTIYKFSSNGKEAKKILLDQEAVSFQIDPMGNIVTYIELEEQGLFKIYHEK